MNNIEQKALALVNEIERERGEDELTPRIMRDLIIDEALCRAIEQREAAKQARADRLLAMHALMAKIEEEREAAKQELSDFKQKVSDAVEAYYGGGYIPATSKFHEFITPAPKPDPLVDAAKMMGYFNTAANAWADDVRAALDALGFEIREKNDDRR